MRSHVETWLEGDGAAFLRRIGLKPGDRVLDFGCGRGHYSIPAAQVVGTAGRVLAMDKEGKALEGLKQWAEKFGLTNLEPRLTAGALAVDSPDGSFDAILAYDVIHYPERREPLFAEFHRVLKGGGFLSVYPKHRRGDHPLPPMACLSLDEIVAEVAGAGFSPRRRFYERLLHDESYNQGVVINFAWRTRRCR